MSRYHVHLCVTDPVAIERDAVITVTCDATSDADAQSFALDVLSNWLVDVQEIEEADPLEHMEPS